MSYRFVDWGDEEKKIPPSPFPPRGRRSDRGEITFTGRESDASGVRFPQVKEENGAEDDSC